MRLIDADELDDIIQILNEKDWGITRGEYKLIDSVLFEFPTIEERKKGHWIKEYWMSERVRKCSACNIAQTVTTHKGKVNFNFCPMCGADMRGV